MHEVKSRIDEASRTIYLSPSAYQMYRDCPAMFRYHYVDDIDPLESAFAVQKDIEKRNIHIEFGSAIHSALDGMYMLRPLEEIINTFTRDTFQFEPHKIKNTLRGIEALEMYYETYFTPFPDPPKIMYSEVSFEYPIERINEWRLVLIGFIDKIVDIGGSLKIIDHKTSSRLSSQDLLILSKENQFKMYFYAAQNYLGIDVKSLIADFIIFWPKNTTLQREDMYYTSQDLNQWRREIVHTTKEILNSYEENIWPRHGRYACSRYNSVCEYAPVCDIAIQLKDTYTRSDSKSNDYETERVLNG